MFNVKCECGKSNMNFKFNIGSSYRGECCDEAQKSPQSFRVATKEELDALGPTIQETTYTLDYSSGEGVAEAVKDLESAVPVPVEPKEPVIQEKKAQIPRTRSGRSRNKPAPVEPTES